MKQCFDHRQPRPASLKRIEQINKIIEDYQSKGYKLTLRQLYYQLVSRDIIPNKKTEYDKLSDLVGNGRKAGLIDWDSIEDRTRYLRAYQHFKDPADAVTDAAWSYSLDLWADQPNYLEVWVEKDALVDVVGKACEDYDVPYFSCRGYVSDSEAYKAGRRLRRRVLDGRQPVILHLGDHDPSGVDMSRDILERLEMFGEISGMVDFHRIALNMEQIDQYDPPPNPAKETDSRCRAYIEKFGSTSWELDALEPGILIELIQSNIVRYLDLERFKARQDREESERSSLIAVASQWDRVAANFT